MTTTANYTNFLTTLERIPALTLPATASLLARIVNYDYKLAKIQEAVHFLLDQRNVALLGQLYHYFPSLDLTVLSSTVNALAGTIPIYNAGSFTVKAPEPSHVGVAITGVAALATIFKNIYEKGQCNNYDASCAINIAVEGAFVTGVTAALPFMPASSLVGMMAMYNAVAYTTELDPYNMFIESMKERFLGSNYLAMSLSKKMEAIDTSDEIITLLTPISYFSIPLLGQLNAPLDPYALIAMYQNALSQIGYDGIQYIQSKLNINSVSIVLLKGEDLTSFSSNIEIVKNLPLVQSNTLERSGDPYYTVGTTKMGIHVSASNAYNNAYKVVAFVATLGGATINAYQKGECKSLDVSCAVSILVEAAFGLTIVAASSLLLTVAVPPLAVTATIITYTGLAIAIGNPDIFGYSDLVQKVKAGLLNSLDAKSIVVDVSVKSLPVVDKTVYQRQLEAVVVSASSSVTPEVEVVLAATTAVPVILLDNAIEQSVEEAHLPGELLQSTYEEL